MRLPHTIETVTGRSFDYHDPEICLEDVAHGLAHVCRFAGHTEHFYSVAEHSTLVSGIVHKLAPPDIRREVAIAALWHDAHEAYMGDLATPLKELVGEGYKQIAARIDRAVCEYLWLDPIISLRHPLIKHADELAMLYEASQLKSGPGWAFTQSLDHSVAESVLPTLGLMPWEAMGDFLRFHNELVDER